ncbi:DUF1667 domain-containing protein [Clostridium sp. D2Q-14]|nr:DUF1667 domain-containing protein [Anaeromonas gelatinilytica]
MGYKISGNKCKRGFNYGIKEMTNPTRVITSTVKIKYGLLPRLPIKSDGEVPKGKIPRCMEIINQVTIQTPIYIGDIIIPNILDTGINIIASRDMETF